VAARSASVVIVGGGFAGVGCARALAGHDIDVTLIDRHNYHQFQPLLYQVATAQVAPSDVAVPLRGIFRKDDNVVVKKATVKAVDPTTRTVTTRGGTTYTADHLVLATGSLPNFFATPGAEEHAFPLYALPDAEQLRTRIFEVFEEADNHPDLIEQGALTFVIIGGGPTGVETAGALADLVEHVMTHRFHDLDVRRARIVLVDHGPSLLGPFSDKAHAYAADVLAKRGVELRMETGAAEIHADRVVLSDGTTLPTRCVVWAGGVRPALVDLPDGVDRGRGGRIAIGPDLAVEGYPGVYAAGDLAEVHDQHGNPLPQLGSVALQTGEWIAHNIRRRIAGKDPKPFEYHDKGIMAMIGRDAAIAELGSHRHELHGHLAFTAWLGVHAALMSGVRTKVDLFMSWAWDEFSRNRAPSIIEDDDAARVDWDDHE
jgi:NADH dehydrogenase